jgi:hypothetical protein
METILFEQKEKHTDKSKWQVNTTDIAIMKSLLIFPYLTAEQICSLHYSKTSMTYLLMRLAWLTREPVDTKEKIYLRRDKEKRHAKSWDPYLYTLSLQGMRHLEKLGQDRPHFYPAPKTINIYQWEHFLLTNEVLISALKFPRVYPETTIWDIKHDFELKHLLKIAIPDDWVHFVINGEHVPIWFEVHIDTGEEKFKKKIASLLQAIRGEFGEKFHVVDPTDNRLRLTVSFLTPKKEEVEKMMLWTKEELLRLGEVREADLFRFAHIPEKDIDPLELFTKPIHQWLGSHGAVTSLI